MNPNMPSLYPRKDLNADLTTLARVLRAPHLTDRDRLRVAGNIVICIRIRHQLGAYGTTGRGRDADFARELAMPMPN